MTTRRRGSNAPTPAAAAGPRWQLDLGWRWRGRKGTLSLDSGMRADLAPLLPDPAPGTPDLSPPAPGGGHGGRRHHDGEGRRGTGRLVEPRRHLPRRGAPFFQGLARATTGGGRRRGGCGDGESGDCPSHLLRETTRGCFSVRGSQAQKSELLLQ
jgi:hypothetical protein